MELKILDLQGKETKKVNLPSQFDELVRLDLISRAFFAIQSHKRQPYGNYELAGKDVCAKLSRRRRDYKTSYGHGISRVPRKILSRSGTHFNWVGALAAGTVGGKRAHPPMVEKVWKQKINKKERRKAIRSGLSATLMKEFVEARGHKVPANFPFIVTSDFENLSKTKEVKQSLINFGLKDELQRIEYKKVRAGKGKMRGRKYKTKKGPLLVVSDNCNLLKAVNNLLGLDIIRVKDLNVDMLAPGAHPGRLTIFTDKALEILNKENLFR